MRPSLFPGQNVKLITEFRLAYFEISGGGKEILQPSHDQLHVNFI